MKIRLDKLDDTTLYRTAEVRLRETSLKTPTASVQRSKVTSSLPISQDVRGINEIWKSINRKDIEGYRTDPRAQRALNNALRTPYNKGSSAGDVNVLFLECDTPRLEDDEVSFVADTIYAYSDIVPLPLVKRLNMRIEKQGQEYFEAYKALVRKAIEDIETLNSKPLMGPLPVLPPALMTQLLDLYLERGIRAFVVDFQGRTPSASEERNLRPVMKQIKDLGLAENVLMYALNANTGRSSGDLGAGVSPAKDILSFGFGFDILGCKHFPLIGPKELYERLRLEGRPEVRLFSKNDYTYRKTTPDRVQEIFPEDATMDLDRFTALASTNRRYEATAVVDMEQKTFESQTLHQVIEEDRVPQYLQTKEGLQDIDYDRMKRARQGWDQGSLRRWS